MNAAQAKRNSKRFLQDYDAPEGRVDYYTAILDKRIAEESKRGFTSVHHTIDFTTNHENDAICASVISNALQRRFKARGFTVGSFVKICSTSSYYIGTILKIRVSWE